MYSNEVIDMLTDTKVKKAVPSEKRYRMADSGGLYLEVLPSGKKSWLYRTSSGDKISWKKIGDYPLFSLKKARDRCEELKKIAAGLIEPEKPALDIKTFEHVALEYLPSYEQGITNDKEKNNTRRRLELHVFPFIGDMDIRRISSRDMMTVAERLQKRNTLETAKKTIQICGRVFRFGILKEYCDSDPCYPLRGALVAPKKNHFAAVTDPEEVAALINAIDAYPRSTVRKALQFSALVFCRPGEIRRAEWSEFDWRRSMWVIPAEKMKARREHVVPLARQTLALLEELKEITGRGQYLFPNNRTPKGNRPMSDGTVLVALRALGYANDQMTAHGFRTMASTILNENNWNYDWIEMQLAHVPKDKIRGAYNRAQYWDGRVEMMQWWADYLDELKTGAKMAVAR